MKAAVLTGIRKMEIREVPVPVLQNETDVLLKVGAVGVCGSDVHYYVNGKIGCQVVRYPFRVGHEAGAVVEKTGRDVSRLKPGDRVAVDPAMPCGKCDQCLCGRPHTCRNLRFLGCPGQAEGCLCEYIVMPEKCCFPIGDGTTLEQAVLVEPLAIGVYAVQLSGSMLGARIGILGCGPIGLSVLMPALVQGAEKVYVTDKIDDRLKVARQAGASWTGNPDREDMVKAISEQEPFLLDVVFECCGQQEALDQAVRLLKPGGKLMLIGIPEPDRVSFSIDELRHREIRLQNVRRQNECVRPAIELIESGKIKVDCMITHRFPLERAGEAFELAAGYRDGVVKAMINM